MRSLSVTQTHSIPTTTRARQPDAMAQIKYFPSCVIRSTTRKIAASKTRPPARYVGSSDNISMVFRLLRESSAKGLSGMFALANDVCRTPHCMHRRSVRKCDGSKNAHQGPSIIYLRTAGLREVDGRLNLPAAGARLVANEATERIAPIYPVNPSACAKH